MASDPDVDDPLVVRIHTGDRCALGKFFARNRDRLRGMVRLRMDRRLQGRIDPDGSRFPLIR
jgi:RNA polymerase sigma-70 factor (ECF subfamily)